VATPSTLLSGETPIQVRAASEQDKEALLAFMASSAGAEKAATLARRWDWQWHRDPRLERPGYQGVVAVWEDKIIANLSCLPAALSLHGEPVDACWLADARVHWGWSRQALKAAARVGWPKQTLFPHGLMAALVDHPATGPRPLGKHVAEAMMAVLDRCGFVDVADAGNRMRRVSLRSPLQKRLGTAAGAIVGRLADLAIALPRPGGLPVQRFEADFDDRFDQLWEQARLSYPAITRRDAAVLNWHYRQHPDTNYQTWIIADGPLIRGYLVLKLWERKGRWVARLVDLLVLPGDQEAIRALVSVALHELREQAAERLDWFVSGGDVACAAEALGFVPRHTRGGRIQGLLVRGLETPAYVTSGDGDGG
jgi:hypothetical protein